MFRMFDTVDLYSYWETSQLAFEANDQGGLRSVNEALLPTAMILFYFGINSSIPRNTR